MPPRPELGPKPRLGYVQSRIERAAELRADDAAIARLAGEPRAGAYVIGGDLIVMKKGAALSDPLFTMEEARALGPASATVFLGSLEGAGRFGYGIAPAAADALKTRDGFHATDLRSIAVQGLVAAGTPAAGRRSQGGAATGTRATASARTAARRRKPCMPAGGAIARHARRNIFRAPIRW